MSLVTLCHLTKVYGIIGDLSTLKCDISDKKLLIEKNLLLCYSLTMADYIRARSDEHKEERLSQIKEATAELFESCPYSEITLTTIAEKLGWSRANLYKYVTTKEEIFLEISAKKNGGLLWLPAFGFSGRQQFYPGCDYRSMGWNRQC